MDVKTDGGVRATSRWLASQVADALQKLQAIATTGNDDLDQKLLDAEQALWAVKVAAENDQD